MWKYQFQFSGYIMAKEKGFYKDVGLDVDIIEADYDIASLVEMKAKRLDFSVQASDIFLENLNNNENFIFLFALTQSSPHMLASIKENGINRIEDLKGKKYLVYNYDYPSDPSITSMLQSQGIDENKFDIVRASSLGIEDLVNGRVDIVRGYSTITPYHLKKMGYTPIVFHPKDYGYDFYSDILYTTKEYIEKNPQTTKNFYEASLKGWEYAFSHVDETINIIKSKYDTQKLDRDILEFEAKEYKKLAFSPGVPFGEINPIKLEKIVNAYKLLGLTTTNKTNFEEFIYNPSPTKSFINLTYEEQKFIDDNLIFKVGFKKNNTPIEFISKEGLYSGISKDILDYISQNTGMGFVYIPLSSEQLKKELQGNKIDFFISNNKDQGFIDFAIEGIEDEVNTVKKISLSFETNNKILQSILEKSTKKLTINQKEAILRKWIPKLIEKPFDWRIVWGISSILGLIIIILLYKNIQQKKNEKKKLELKVKKRTNELNSSLDEKALLLKELNHRVKNNMQMIISLLRLQSDRTEDEKLNEVIITIQNRINAMSKLHELLYNQDSVRSLDTYEYFERLIDELEDSIENEVEISLIIETDLNIEQAIYCGLILNELVTNSLKYAFVDSEDKQIYISLTKEGNWYTLIVKDNGKGYNQKTSKDSLGLTIVKRLVDRQLDGSMIIDSSNGVNTKITWIKDAKYKNISS
ncbi:MAG: ABC transporter substrate-binding protein [Campylobacterota bacterium]|nr:ABC transporter substrate-binding protein [Campylobacterota bacterium]